LCGAAVVSLVISDVPRNPLDTIASGPVSPDMTTFCDAKTVLEKYRLWDKVPESVRTRILKGVNHQVDDTPGVDDVFDDVHSYIVGDAMTSCGAVREKIRDMYGECCPVHVHPEVMEGVVTEQVAQTLLDAHRGFTLIGHELTYGADMSEAGEGGRNLHLLLLMLKMLKRAPESCNSYVEGIATDGKDGNSWAGALITPSLVRDTLCEEIEKAVREENSGGFFRDKGYLIRMKSTYGLDNTSTNVNNIVIVYNPENL
jgi:glycerate 2-kinase